MLILTRRPDESIMLGDDVVITVLSVKGQQVRLGIDAPKDVEVHRQEVYERIGKAAGGGGGDVRVDEPDPA